MVAELVLGMGGIQAEVKTHSGGGVCVSRAYAVFIMVLHGFYM